MKIFHYDVVVVGGGEAGLRAAIEARRSGADVALLSRGTAGKGGASAIAVGTHSAVTLPEDSAQQFANDIVKAGAGLADAHLALLLANGSRQAIEDLLCFGVDMLFEKDLRTPGHSHHRRWYPRSRRGVEITKRLRHVFESEGGRVYDNATVCDFIKSDAVVGVIAQHEGESIGLIAPQTVLATGGFGYLYKNTDNPSDVRGDGILLASKSGATLTDLEFTQFYPYQLISPKNFDVSTRLFSRGAFMRNRDGRRILEDFPSKELETRDIVSRVMEEAEDVYLDIDAVPASVLKEDVPRLWRILTEDPKAELLLRPVAHYTLGGVVIDGTCRTGVRGLLACGECAGGVHGANRLGGNAMTEALVFGAIAGRQAAMPLSFDRELAADMARKVFDIPIASWPPTGLREFAAEFLGIRRSPEGALKAYDTARPIDHRQNYMAGYWDLLSMIAQATSARTESRGVYAAEGFTNVEQELRGSFRFKDGAMRFAPMAQR